MEGPLIGVSFAIYGEHECNSTVNLFDTFAILSKIHILMLLVCNCLWSFEGIFSQLLHLITGFCKTLSLTIQSAHIASTEFLIVVLLLL